MYSAPEYRSERSSSLSPSQRDWCKERDRFTEVISRLGEAERQQRSAIACAVLVDPDNPVVPAMTTTDGYQSTLWQPRLFTLLDIPSGSNVSYLRNNYRTSVLARVHHLSFRDRLIVLRSHFGKLRSDVDAPPNERYWDFSRMPRTHRVPADALQTVRTTAVTAPFPGKFKVEFRPEENAVFLTIDEYLVAEIPAAVLADGETAEVCCGEGEIVGFGNVLLKCKSLQDIRILRGKFRIRVWQWLSRPAIGYSDFILNPERLKAEFNVFMRLQKNMTDGAIHRFRELLPLRGSCAEPQIAPPETWLPVPYGFRELPDDAATNPEAFSQFLSALAGVLSMDFTNELLLDLRDGVPVLAAEDGEVAVYDAPEVAGRPQKQLSFRYELADGSEETASAILPFTAELVGEFPRRILKGELVARACTPLREIFTTVPRALAKVCASEHIPLLYQRLVHLRLLLSLKSHNNGTKDGVLVPARWLLDSPSPATLYWDMSPCFPFYDATLGAAIVPLMLLPDWQAFLQYSAGRYRLDFSPRTSDFTSLGRTRRSQDSAKSHQLT